MNLNGPIVTFNIPSDLYNKAKYYESQQIPSCSHTVRHFTDLKPFNQNVAGGKTRHFEELLKNNHPLLMPCLLA